MTVSTNHSPASLPSFAPDGGAGDRTAGTSLGPEDPTGQAADDRARPGKSAHALGRVLLALAEGRQPRVPESAIQVEESAQQVTASSQRATAEQIAQQVAVGEAEPVGQTIENDGGFCASVADTGQLEASKETRRTFDVFVEALEAPEAQHRREKRTFEPVDPTGLFRNTGHRTQQAGRSVR